MSFEEFYKYYFEFYNNFDKKEQDDLDKIFLKEYHKKLKKQFNSKVKKKQ